MSHSRHPLRRLVWKTCNSPPIVPRANIREASRPRNSETTTVCDIVLLQLLRASPGEGRCGASNVLLHKPYVLVRNMNAATRSRPTPTVDFARKECMCRLSAFSLSCRDTSGVFWVRTVRAGWVSMLGLRRRTTPSKIDRTSSGSTKMTVNVTHLLSSLDGFCVQGSYIPGV